MNIARALVFAGVVLLAACQSTANNEGGGTPAAPVAPAGAAQITAAVVAVTQSREGTLDRWELLIAFRSRNGVGAHLTHSRLCHVVDGSCINRDFDFTVPPTGTVAVRTWFASDYGLDVDGYTTYLTGTDTRGNPVQTQYSFSSNTVGRLPPVPN